MSLPADLRLAQLAARFQRATPEVTDNIRLASTRTGVDFAYLMEKAAAESGFRPDAKASTSSASGLFQFIESTWLQLVKEQGPKYGYGRESSEISVRADGRHTVNDPEARKRILDLRFDPKAASLLAAEYANQNRDHLRNTVGGDITSTDLYLAHFLGPQGAAKFISALRQNPNQTAANLFPEAARANRGVFFREGTPRTLQQVYDRFDARFQTALREVGINPPEPEAVISAEVDRGHYLLAREKSSAKHPDATAHFTVMMLSQLAAPFEGEKQDLPTALGNTEDADKRSDSASKVLVPTIGL